MAMYRIVLTGWHADTVVDLELTEAAVAIVRKLAETTTAAGNWMPHWQPSMYLKPHTDPGVQRELAEEAARRDRQMEHPF